MKYTVRTISEILGISVTTIRKYESLGIIQPNRNLENNYRMYDAVDVNIIRRVRYYTGLGLTIKDAAALVLHGSVKDLSREFDHACERSRKQIELEYLKCSFFRSKQHHINRILPMLNSCCIENCPPMFGIVYRENDTFLTNPMTKQLVNDWNSIHPFAESGVFYKQEDFFQPGYSIDHGYLIEKQYADYFDIKENEQVKFFPERKCLYIFAPCAREPEIVYEKSYKLILQGEMNRLGLKMNGDPFERIIHTSKESGSYIHYVETWIPIE